MQQNVQRYSFIKTLAGTKTVLFMPLQEMHTLPTDYSSVYFITTDLFQKVLFLKLEYIIVFFYRCLYNILCLMLSFMFLPGFW